MNITAVPVQPTSSCPWDTPLAPTWGTMLIYDDDRRVDVVGAIADQVAASYEQ